ncbi:hypothetical protein D3C76_918810 [compost metagenome]
MVVTAVAGQVDEHQVLWPAAFGQGARSTGEAFAGSHGAGGHLVTMIDQGDLAVGAKTDLEHVADIVGFAQEHALLAIAGHHQAVELNGRLGQRDPGQCFFEQPSLIEQGEVERVGQQLAMLVAHAHAVDPVAALDLAIGQDQPTIAVVRVVGEPADVLAAIGQQQRAVAGQAPVDEAALVVAAIAAEQLAFADQRAILEFADPDVAVGVLEAAPAFEAVVLEFADVLLAIDAVVGAAALQ